MTEPPGPDPRELAAAEREVHIHAGTHGWIAGKRVMAEYDRMKAVLADPTDEDSRLVAEALHCADTGDAGHWPIAAGILADEVRRLRADRAMAEGYTNAAYADRQIARADLAAAQARITALLAVADAAKTYVEAPEGHDDLPDMYGGLVVAVRALSGEVDGG
jgi:hypothetical protein